MSTVASESDQMNVKDRDDLYVGDLIGVLSEPVLLVTPRGLIQQVNTAARVVAGRDLIGLDLCELAGDRASKLRTYLKRCSGSRGVLPGVIDLPHVSGVKTYRCNGSLLSSGSTSLVFLRCQDVKDDRFVLLTKRVEELHQEIQDHLHTQATLKDALRDREILVDEIHHRVKNNVQILQSILSAASRKVDHPSALSCLEDASRQLTAISSVQHLLYHCERPTSYPADELVNSLIPAVQSTLSITVSIHCKSIPFRLPINSAVPLALIITELITNASKYGRSEPSRCDIKIKLSLIDQEVELWVQDKGRGFDVGEIRSRSSGLGLVEGLSRQLGGTFAVEKRDGACCIVRFPWNRTSAFGETSVNSSR